MKMPFFIIALLITCGAAAQKDTTLYYFEEVGLFINVPSKFKVLTAEENKSIRARGEKAIEEANKVDIDASATTTLISVKEGQFNYLDVTITPNKNFTAQGYAEEYQLAKDVLYKAFADKVPAEDIDTTSSVTTINGLSFDIYQLKLKLAPSATMQMFILSRYYKGYDLGISYAFIDERIGKEMETIIRQITFKK